MVLYEITAILVYMQDVDLIEKLTGFVGRLYERIRDWEFRHLWIARLCVYLVLLMVVSGVCHLVFDHFGLYHTNADSARYMLSAMVQAQAAIVAIVITLTLIAVQLTASAYSPRVIRIFRDNPDMWLLLGFYGLSMLYGLVVLKMVVGVDAANALGEIGMPAVVSHDVFWPLGCVSISFEFCVSFAYWLEVFTLVALFPYMLNIINLLEPENIINRLAENITKGNVLKFIKSKEKQRWNRTSPAKDDPMQPIMDVIHGSVMKYDITTTGYGLKAITEKAIEVVHLDYEKETSRHFCDHLGRIGKMAVSREDGESVIKVLESLKSFGESTAEKRLKVAPLQAAQSLGVVGKIIAENGLEDATKQVALSLECVGKLTAENGLGGATFEVTKSLGVILKIVAENGRGDATKQVARSLGVVGIVAYNRMVAAEKDGKQEEWKELDTVTCEVAKHLVKLSMKLSLSSEELREIFLDGKQRYLDLESIHGFIFERYNEEYELELEKLQTQNVD